MTVLTAKQIKASLKAVADWSQSAHTIYRTFKFEGFLNRIASANRITRMPQNLNHYPDIDIRFDPVTLTLTTHDAGGITEKDFSVARQCDEVFLSFLNFDQGRLSAKPRRSEHDENKDMSDPTNSTKTKSSMSVMNAIQHRRSVRDYTSRTIKKRHSHAAGCRRPRSHRHA
jgi:4a-hydroxytetrahydrobiopterin dehydratase